jgi:chromosome segregation ATPase
MGGALLTPLDLNPTGADLTALVVRLLAEVDQLRADVSTLRRENLELRQQASYWQSRHADALRRIATLQQHNDQLQGEIRQLQAERFGRRCDKPSGNDRSQELDDPADTQPQRRRGRQPA